MKKWGGGYWMRESEGISQRTCMYNPWITVWLVMARGKGEGGKRGEMRTSAIVSTI